MKPSHLFLSILMVGFLALASCTNERSTTQQTSSEPDETAAGKPAETVKNEDKTLDVPWTAVYNDSTQLLEIKKNPVARPGNLNEQDLIDALNLKYPQVRLTPVARQGNKLTVEIEDAEYFTQEMGTAGARAYLAEATYSLTELSGIEAVDFRFKVGDHAMPGVLTRRSFENFN